MRAKSLLNLVGDRLHSLPLLVLYLTDGCNSRCVTCDIWRSPRRNMRLELVDELLKACRELQVRWVLLSGGEAMQHPHWPEIARRFRDVGARVILLTNGLLLARQAAQAVASLDEVIVSLDGGRAETYAAIRGVDGWARVLEGIQAVRAGGAPVTTRTTLQKLNFREMPAIIQAARAAGANRISFLAVDVSSVHAFGPRFTAYVALHAAAGGADSQPGPDPMAVALSPAEVIEFAQVVERVIEDFADDFASGLIAEPPAKLRRLVQYFAALNGDEAFPVPRCNAPHTSVVVEVDGSLRPCYFLPIFGRLGDAGAPSLGQALNVPAAQALRQAYRAGERPECARCVCPLYKGPRALLRM